MTRIDRRLDFVPCFFQDLRACLRASGRRFCGAAGRLAGLAFGLAVLWSGTAGGQNVTLTVGPNVDVSKFTGNESDGVIAVDPLAPKQVFVAGNINVNNGIFGQYSTDGGSTWHASSLTKIPVGAYPAVAWDGYGNLFLAYVDSSFAGIDLAVSTNGGANFTLLTNLATNDTTVQPRIAVGSDATNGSLWVVYKDYNLANQPVVAQGVPVTGLGAFGAFGAQQIASGSMNNCGFGDVAVGANGQVMVAFQNNVGSFGKATLYVSVDPDGLGPHGFGTPVVATTNAIAGNTHIPAYPGGQGVNAAAGLAWDTNPASSWCGRAYLVYTGQGTGGTNDLDIFLRYSTNSGTNWSSAARVNDDTGSNSQFMPRLAVDPTDGEVALSWYDCRNDLGAIIYTQVLSITNVTTDTNGISTTNITSTNIVHTNMTGTVDMLPNDDAQFYATVSVNGGVRFQPNVMITSTNWTTNAYESSLAGSPTDFGEYTGLAFYGGNFYPVWADNSGSAGANLGGRNSTFDTALAAVANSGLADLSITGVLTNTTTPVQNGSVVTYFLTVSNAGPSNVKSGVVTELFSPDLNFLQSVASQSNGNILLNGNSLVWTLGNLAKGSTATILIKTTVNTPGTLTNIASVASEDLDLLTNNNTSKLVTPYYVSADLALAMTGSPSVIGIGQPLVAYTLTVTNLGQLAAGGVVISDTLPASLALSSLSLPAGVTCVTNQNAYLFNIGALTNGQSAVVGMTATALSSGLFINSATVSGSVADTNLANNSAQVVTTVTNPPPLIANLAVTNASATAVFITWDTTSNATAQVAYGLTPAYGQFSWLNPNLSQHHVVMLTGLLPATNYFFEVLSIASGNLAVTNGSFSTISPLILNTQDAYYSGLWSADNQAAGIFGSYYQFSVGAAGNSTASAAYTPNIPVSANYDVFIWYPAKEGASSNTPVIVTGATNVVLVNVDQTVNAGSWQLLAPAMYFARGTGGSLVINNNIGGTNNAVVANAVQWAYSLSQDASTSGGVPAWWAGFYFGTNVVASADADGDGYSNYAEYVLGTCPTNSLDYLQFSASPATSTNVTVTFAPYQGGRSYQLQSATNLANPTWLTLTNTATETTSGTGVFTVSRTGGAPVFYRLATSLSP
jgi:uncharacterized repeat protein (TIGR01451 family)